MTCNDSLQATPEPRGGSGAPELSRYLACMKSGSGNVGDLGSQCFFCSGAIQEKKTKEHVIPDRLLGRLGIKEATLTGERVTQYSRIKVPAHASCNNEFGSLYEGRVLELLADTGGLYEALLQEEREIPLMYGPDESASAILTTWLSKIFYGLFYDDALKTKDRSWRDVCRSVIESENFGFVRRSYENGYGFQLPSSLYAFWNENKAPDLVTIVSPSAILLKIENLTLVLCVCDGYLTKNYLNEESLETLRMWVSDNDRNNIDFPSHRLALGEVVALMRCIPKSPRFVSSDGQIINMSLSTMAAHPDKAYAIDTSCLQNARADIFEEFGLRFE